jgi:hypothetical protein
MATVKIDIASEFTGKKAFKEAETSTDKLGKSVKSLAKGLIAVYSAQKILSYAKASVKAFAEDEKAAASLGTTLKNLGLAYGSNIGTVNGFISRLEQQTGVLDDELRPAMDRLLRATGDVTKSQELLGLALDIAAGTGKSVTQVSQSLQKAYLGQTQALGRLGVGLTKAELSTSSFEEIQDRLAVLFAGQATAAADTYAGSLAKLTVAGNNAKETIGKGLVDAFVTITNSSSIDDLVEKIDTAAEAIANFVRETGKFIEITKSIFKFELFAPSGGLFGDGKGFGNIQLTGGTNQDTQKADLAARKKAEAELLKILKAQQAAAAKIAKDKRIGLLIDKANIALQKSGEVFDMDKIQIAAALANQAEQLGKATSSAQQMQIANDVARLNVKRSINELEDAIAAKDEKAIINATAKLNEDLKVLGALNGQKVTLTSIESILAGLKPKELIDQENLNEALRKIQQMLDLLAEANAQSKAKVPSSSTLGTGIPVNDYIEPISKEIAAKGSIAAILEYADAASARANAFADLLDMDTAAKTQALQSSPLYDNSGALQSFRQSESAAMGNTIIVNTGVGDPNAIAEAIDQVLQEAVQRGTLRGGLYAV